MPTSHRSKRRNDERPWELTPSMPPAPIRCGRGARTRCRRPPRATTRPRLGCARQAENARPAMPNATAATAVTEAENSPAGAAERRRDRGSRDRERGDRDPRPVMELHVRVGRGAVLQLRVGDGIDPGGDHAQQPEDEQRDARAAGEPEQRSRVGVQHRQEHEADERGDVEARRSGPRPSTHRTDQASTCATSTCQAASHEGFITNTTENTPIRASPGEAAEVVEAMAPLHRIVRHQGRQDEGERRHGS